eukprot:6476096-Pyramimonas_sp.AAC.1
MDSVLLHPRLLKKVFGELQVPRARGLRGAPRLSWVLHSFRNEQPPANHCKLKCGSQQSVSQRELIRLTLRDKREPPQLGCKPQRSGWSRTGPTGSLN